MTMTVFSAEQRTNTEGGLYFSGASLQGVDFSAATASGAIRSALELAGPGARLRSCLREEQW